MIPFNVPPCVGDELEYVKQAIDSHKICGDGAFTKQCNAWLEERFHAQTPGREFSRRSSCPCRAYR